MKKIRKIRDTRISESPNRSRAYAQIIPDLVATHQSPAISSPCLYSEQPPL